ncbi:MAG: hypothetical protein Q7T24_05410, partial [Deltaproteobacteria bacterium]|nr:hypothetical protein [Deltaproteobacteria bacterium]
NYAFALMPPVTLIIFLVLGDPLYQAIGSYRSLSMGRLYSYLLLYLSMNLALFAALYAFFSVRGFKAFPASLLYMSVCSSLSLFANQAIGQYQTRSQYGEKGAIETVSFIRSEIPLSSRVIVPGDIGFYAGVKFAKASPIEEGSATVPEWDWIVERRANIIRLKPEDMGAIYANYRLFKSIGSYEIYRRR